MNDVSQKRKITPGIYQHFKGGLYQVLLIASILRRVSGW